MTPAELKVYAEAYVEQHKSREKLARLHIYNLASLIRVMVLAKHPPSYETAFPNDVHNEPMTDDQMYAQVKALNALWGGKEE